MFHIFDICQSIAQKLPELNRPEISSSVKSWNEGSLANGWPSLSLFYSILDAHFPDQKYDQMAHEYLTISLSKANHSLSILDGTSGLCFAVFMCSQDKLRYKKLLSQLDQQLLQELDLFFQKTKRTINDYSLFNGVCGALAYLLLRQNDSQLLFYAKECLTAIVNFIQSEKIVSGCLVRGWHEESSDSPNGRFALNSLHGVSGLLSVLALASIDGLSVKGHQEAICSLSQWLENKQRAIPEGSMWPAVVSFEEEIGEKEDERINMPNIWFYGSSAIARSLYLAYKALGNSDLKNRAEQTFLKTLSVSSKGLSSSFAFGKAGLLAMAYRMYQDTKNRALLEKVNELEFELKNEFNPNALFGFQTRDFTTKQPKDDPGILDGAIGTALTLLLVADKKDMNWDRLFLLR